MQNIIEYINNNSRNYIRYLLLALSVAIVVVIVPKKGKFKYEYELGKPWIHEDLVAPFTFAVMKTPMEINDGENEIKENFKPYYIRDQKVENEEKDKFVKELSKESAQEGEISNNLKKYYLSRGLTMLDDIYSKGIINLDTLHKNKPKEFIITELKNNVATDKQLVNYFTLPETRSSIIQRAETDSILNQGWFIKSLLASLAPNVTYDKKLSEKKLDESLDALSKTRGIIKQDDKIIARGTIVTPERYRVLESLRIEYENNIGKSYTIPLGYLIIITCLFLMFGINIEFFNREIAASNRSLILILINVLIFIGLTSYITIQGVYNVYLIPYCIVPIVLLAFFGIRIAIITHFLVVFICGLIVANPFEFILLQTFAGFAAALSMARLRYVSQFFISALLIFFAYSSLYIGITLVKTSVLRDIDWQEEWFAGNFVLTLIAYPLVYANEKIFGFLSDIRILEFADINSKLLKELFLRAPGTFQHSLQVANLVESILDRIGGNPLLGRVGALYHDIGKIYNPDFFTENQKGGINPHKDLDELESAEIIIAHVTQGVELARKNHIPKQIIDFIRTHHGTTRVEFFYRNYILDHKDADETVFRYPGPKPYSKEMAVLMMADSVEAASRSLKNQDDKQIDALVDQIIDAKLADNQFDNASITIQEINSVRRILKKQLKSIYHIRVEYPVEQALK